MAASRFAGMYDALQYAYGCGRGLPPALVIDVGNAASTTASDTVAFGQIPLQDGTIISPLSTLCPITVGIGTNAETVTPSAVSNPSLTVYSQSSFTAAFTNAHGTGDSISSATFGLQEAINAANAAGGGVVVVSGRWAQAGGTTAIINAATLPTNGTVGIQDTRNGGGAIQTATIPISNANVKLLFGTGSILVPAPGTTSAIDLIDMVIENVFLTAAYTAGGVIQASYGTGVTVPASATIAATFLTSPTASQMIKVQGALASTLSSSVLNKALYLNCATQEFATGAGSLIVKINYRILTGL